MAFTQLTSEILQLRGQGLPDNIIREELKTRGYAPAQVEQALFQADGSGAETGGYQGYEQQAFAQTPAGNPSGAAQFATAGQGAMSGNIYERIEEITESIIDEKWEELLAEVKKIVEWKEKVEEKQSCLQQDLEKLKADFVLLHQGVLGKLEDYDTRMRDVGTELKAVGKVFKDVIPEFVENVKELRDITERTKKN